LSESWLATFIPAALLIILALYNRAYGSSWLEPGAYIALVWSFYVFLPLLFAPNYYIWPIGVWWILISIFAVSCGSAIITGFALKQHQDNKLDNIHIALEIKNSEIKYFNGIRWVLLFSIGAGILSTIIIIWFSGRSLSVFFSPRDYIDMAVEFSVGRYSQTYIPPLLARGLSFGLYLSPVLGGMLYATRRNKLDGFLSALSIIPEMFEFIVHTTRFAFILAFILWGAGFFGTVVLFHRNRVRIFNKRIVLTMIGLVVIMGALFGVGQVIRGGEDPTKDALTETIASPNTRAAALGHISVFARWLNESWADDITPTFGAYTFTGLFEFLGLPTTPFVGLYSENHEVEPGGITNIYTIFRGLIEDFTLAGSLVFLFIFGFLAGLAYINVLRGKSRWMPVLISYYGFVPLYMVSLFYRNGILFALLILYIYIYLLSYYDNKEYCLE
jgi:oligosaccharide repeat unit polymerase